MSNFKKFKEHLPNKKKIYRSMTVEKLVKKGMDLFLRFVTDLKGNRSKFIAPCT